MKTLVIATRKNFWASPESNCFSNRVHTWILWGYSEDRFNTLLLVARSLIYLWIKRPEMVVVSQAARAAVWFSYLIRWRIVPKAKWIAIDPVYLHRRHWKYYSKVLVYCSNQLKGDHKENFKYIPLPANGNFDGIKLERGNYFVSIGIAYRDFKSLIQAARIEKLPLIIVTKSKETLSDVGEIPDHVTIHYSIPIQECVDLVAKSRGVIVPLLKGEIPHGHSAVVQALRLGKALISTKRATVDDYITDGVEGLLVEAGDVKGYAAAMKRLWDEDGLLTKFERNALKKSEQFTYSYFAQELRRVVEGLRS